MVTVHLGPSWFFGIDATLEAIAALIAFFVAVAAYKVYHISGERKYGFFTASFVLITLSFLSRATADMLLENLLFEVPQALTSQIFLYGYLAHILLAVVAYVILIVITHKIEDKRVIALLILAPLLCLLLSASYYISFYGLSALFLVFVALAYFQNYKKVCSPASCMVFISFLLLALAQVQFLLDLKNSTFYVSAQITQAIGYLILFAALLKIRFKPQSHEKIKTRHRV